MGKIILREFNFFLPMTLSGKEVKFNLTESFYMDLEFEQLKSNYMELVKFYLYDHMTKIIFIYKRRPKYFHFRKFNNKIFINS